MLRAAVAMPRRADRLSSITHTRGGAALESHTWSYDSAGRRTADVIGDGTRWEHGYNARNEVTSSQRKVVSGDVPLAGYQFGFAYDAIGNRRSTTVNGRYASHTVNALNQYTSRDVPPTVDVLGSTAADAVVTVTGPLGAQTATKQGTNFAAEVPVADNAGTPQHPNLTVEAKRVTGSGTPGTVTKSTQSGRVFVARQPEVFTHDFDGNQTTDGRWTRIWDAENRLIAEETTATAVAAGVLRTRLEHAYDGQSRRIRTVVKTGPSLATVTTRRFVYGIGWNVLVELNASITVQRRCLWGPDLSGSLTGAGGVGGLLVETIAGVDYLPCYDGNGNITALIKATDGTEAARYTYGPFGELLRMTGAVAKSNPFRFSTKYCDEETGLFYYGYRYYQPQSAYNEARAAGLSPEDALGEAALEGANMTPWSLREIVTEHQDAKTGKESWKYLRKHLPQAAICLMDLNQRAIHPASRTIGTSFCHVDLKTDL